MKKPKLFISDQRMFKLIDELKARQVIRYRQEFCDMIKIDKQNIRNIRLGTQHFTIQHIRKACTSYGVSANWIFGLEEKIFRMPIGKAMAEKG